MKVPRIVKSKPIKIPDTPKTFNYNHALISIHKK